MKISINPHWLAKILPFKLSLSCITLKGADVLIEGEHGCKSINLAELNVLPKFNEGIFFSTICFDKEIIRWLPKESTKLFISFCQKEWYLVRFPKIADFYTKVDRYLVSSYTRTSKFKKIQKVAKNLKATYQVIPKEGLLSDDLYDKFQFVDQIVCHGNSVLNQYRSDFVARETQCYKHLFDTVESNPLTSRQREACVIDDDNNLVLAGAGTGKTSTMVGKAGYLVESGKAKPEELLLLAFGKKAAEELQERIIEKLNNPIIQASTFHKIGKYIIAQVEGKSPSVSDLATDDVARDKYVDTLLNELLKDPEYERKAVTYFEKYLHPDINPFDFQTEGEYLQSLEANDIRSLNGDPVKSHGELLIANYLFVHGIEYQYEAPYKISTQTLEFQQYKPDFYLKDYDIYIEHYGIDRNNNTAPYINSVKYNQDIAWKKKLHSENGTACLETFHYQKQENTLLDDLASQLNAHNIPLEPIPDDEVLTTLRSLGQVSKFSKLLSTLLVNAKNRCKDINEINAIAALSDNSEQALAAFDLLSPIFENYNQLLEDDGEIDFNDMIHRATQYVIDKKFIPKWKYILIDEFQDIALARANLVKALRDYSELCALFCVGDDWQSIYRFTGSDLSLTTNFGQEFGDYSIVKLDKTYRFNNSICDVATEFVTRNPTQEKKQLMTHDIVDKSAVSIMKVKNSCDMAHVASALDRISIEAQSPSSVYVISRYNFLVDDQQLFTISKQYPQLDIKSISMHGSKGKEADYVIIIGLERGKHGFPSEKLIHPLLELFLPKEEAFPKAEERRLFYVAITRAKKRVYLITDMSKPSSFMQEILLSTSYDLCLNEFDTSIEQEVCESIHCPLCKTGILSLRPGNFIGCSNYDRCTYTESSCPKCCNIMSHKGRFRVCINCGWKIAKCQECTGEMRKTSTGHWGCSNYRGKDSKPTCTFQETYIEY